MTKKTEQSALKLKWRQARQFEALTPEGRQMVFDGDKQAGLAPMEALLASLCGCMAIDVVLILEKMRVDLKGLEISATGQRREEAPRYFQKIRLGFIIDGEVPRSKIERAVELSFEKYCSVLHSLRRDLDITYTIGHKTAA